MAASGGAGTHEQRRDGLRVPAARWHGFSVHAPGCLGKMNLLTFNSGVVIEFAHENSISVDGSHGMLNQRGGWFARSARCSSR